MNEKDFIDKMAEKRGITKKEAKELIDDYNSLKKEALLEAGTLTINDMGKYILQEKPAREARNPMTGETVKVPAKTVVKWRPNKKFKDEVLAKPKKKK